MVVLIILILIILYFIFRPSNEYFIDIHKEDTTYRATTPHPNERFSTIPPAESFANLTQKQKYASIGLLLFFQGASYQTAHETEATKMVALIAKLMGMYLPNEVEHITSTMTDADEIISLLQTIRNRNVTDLLLYNCYGLYQLSGKEELKEFLYGIFSELGYTPHDVRQTVRKIESLGQY